MADAVLKLAKTAPSLIVLELGNNKINALEFTKRIRETKAIKAVPILFIGELSKQEDIEKSVSLEISGAIAVNSPTLLAEVKMLLQM